MNSISMLEEFHCGSVFASGARVGGWFWGYIGIVRFEVGRRDQVVRVLVYRRMLDGIRECLSSCWCGLWL